MKTKAIDLERIFLFSALLAMIATVWVIEHPVKKVQVKEEAVQVEKPAPMVVPSISGTVVCNSLDECDAPAESEPAEHHHTRNSLPRQFEA